MSPLAHNQPNKPRCQLCGAAKLSRHYNAAPLNSGVTYRETWLCPRCDLAADPPVQIHRGTE